MAHFAKLDDSNIVLEVVVVNNNELTDDEEISGIKFLKEWSGGYSSWKQTSYNGSIRKNYAGPGYIYDPIRDAFIAPKPDSVDGIEPTLNEETCCWKFPEQAE